MAGGGANFPVSFGVYYPQTLHILSIEAIYVVEYLPCKFLSANF